MNLKIGLVCSLTGEKPIFEDTCSEFIKDEAEAKRKFALKMDAAGNAETSKGTNPKQNKTIGAALFIVGLGVTIASFLIEYGSYVIIAYGSIIYGASWYIKGMQQEKLLKENEILEDKISKK